MRRLLPALAVLVFSCAPATVSTPPSTSPTGGDAVDVDFVIDGDTFDATDGRRFRLDGINAPDRGECGYEEARDHLASLIEGSTITTAIAGSDQFGRILVDAHVDDLWVNRDLVSNGLALATTPGESAGDDLVEAEAAAFAQRVGLWSEVACGASGPVPAVRFDPGSSVTDPPGPDEEDLAGELIVVINEGTTAVDLSGWVLRDESSRHRFAFSPGTVLSPRQPVSVTSADPGWDPGHSPVWNNAGDIGLLLDQFGRVVDRFRY